MLPEGFGVSSTLVKTEYKSYHDRILNRKYAKFLNLIIQRINYFDIL